MKILGMSIALAGTLLASDYSYEVSPMFGGFQPEDKLNIDRQTAYGARFQMNDYNLFGLVPELSFDRTTDTDYDTQVGDTVINRYGFNGLHDFKDFSDTLVPYFLVGLGYEDVKDEPLVNYDSSLYVNYGGGIKWKVVEDIALRAEVKHLLRTNDSGDELYYGIGLSIPFGEKASEPVKEEEPAPVEEVVETAPMDSDKDGVSDAQDKCPNTPAGRSVDVNGCEFDGDNDGVVDAQDKCSNTPAGRSVDTNGCEIDSDKDGVVDGLDQCPNTVSGVSVDVNGCAESIILAIKFEYASSKINEKDSPQLKEYADFMKRNSAYDVTIVGHTDSMGSAEYNQKLSQARADSVKANLVRNGVEASRIKTAGKGEDEPMADNGTAEGRAENRRIEAKLKLND